MALPRATPWRAEFQWLQSTRNPQAVRAYVELLARLTDLRFRALLRVTAERRLATLTRRRTA